MHLVDLDFALNISPTIVPSPSPRHMGHECVCQIVETGKEVSKLKKGKLDYTPVWYQEVDLLGSLIHGIEDWKGEKKSTFEIVIELLETKKIPSTISEIIAHRYKISDYIEAIEVAFNKMKNRAIKVIFDYEN